MEIHEIIISFIFTGVIGSIITNKFQKNNFINQVNIMKVEKDIEKIKEITKNIEIISSQRRLKGLFLIEALTTQTSDEDIQEARNKYILSVSKWNDELSPILIELHSIGLSSIASSLEFTVHKTFYNAHESIRKILREKNKCDINHATELFENSYAETKRISHKLIKTSNMKWEKAIYGEMENLTKFNLEQANIWVLLVAIFHKKPDSLRISSSRHS